MAGLAAALNAPGCLDALCAALAARGADVARSTIGCDGTVLEIAVRAALPEVARVVADPEAGRAGVVALLAVDGIASVSALDSSYAEHGPIGLLTDGAPYAVVLADAEQDSLALARCGDGPGLYYARHGAGWLVASEPLALLAAGVAAEPDVEIIRDFVATGHCDTDRRTFLARVRRVGPSEAVVLSASGEVDVVALDPPSLATSVPAALATAVTDAPGIEVGLLAGPGLPGAALLGTALARADRRPVPVHTLTYPDVGGSPPAVLKSLAFGAVRHVEHTLDLAELDVDAFLTDLGEPVGDLGLLQLWAAARRVGGDVDVLVDSTEGDPAGLSRLRDRVAARYGVEVRSPLRAFEPHLTNAYESIVDNTLPEAAARSAAADPARPLSPADLLLSTPDHVAAKLAVARPWRGGDGVTALRRVAAGEPAQAESLLRAYLVERWLALVARVAPGPLAIESIMDRSAAAEPRPAVAPGASDPPGDVEVAGAVWCRRPVRTEVFRTGEAFAAKVAWAVTWALDDLSQDREIEEALRGPWFVMLSGKAVAVAQRRVRPLWDIVPGWAARTLSAVARKGLPRLAQPRAMQVALEDAGRLRVGGAVLASHVVAGWARRLLPAPAANLFPPRADALAPADGAVVQAPARPDDTAATVVDAIRFAAPAEQLACLAGVAVVSADAAGSRLLGFAPGPGVDAIVGVGAAAVAALLCRDNPAGQADEQTPIVLAYPAPPRRRPTRPAPSAPGQAEVRTAVVAEAERVTAAAARQDGISDPEDDQAPAH